MTESKLRRDAWCDARATSANKTKTRKRQSRFNREVLQTEFRFRFRKGPRQISAGPGWSTPEEVEPNFLFCKPNFLFRFGSINSKKCVVLATRCIVMSKNTTEKLNPCLLATRPLLMESVGPSRSPTERLANKTSFLNVFSAQSQTQVKHESRAHPMIVLWWCTANNRLFELAVHNHLSLSLPLSFSSPSYFPSFSKQAKRKSKLRFADKDQV